MEKSLLDYSEQELKEALPTHTNRGVVFNYNDIRNELERRRQQKNADRTFYIALVAIIVSVASLITSVLVALVK